MFFASNSLWYTFQSTVLDASYGKGDKFCMLIVIHPNVYQRLLKEAFDTKDTLLVKVDFEIGCPIWDMGRFKLKFLRSRDITETTVHLIEDTSLHIITILHNGEEKNTMP